MGIGNFSRFKIYLELDGRKLTEYVTSKSFVVGRSSQCDLSVASKNLSRDHLKVSLEEDGIYVEDLKSTNGSFFDGNRLEPGKKVKYSASKNLVLGKQGRITLEIYAKFQYRTGQVSQILRTTSPSYSVSKKVPLNAEEPSNIHKSDSVKPKKKKETLILEKEEGDEESDFFTLADEKSDVYNSKNEDSGISDSEKEDSDIHNLKDKESDSYDKSSHKSYKSKSENKASSKKSLSLEEEETDFGQTEKFDDKETQRKKESSYIYERKSSGKAHVESRVSNADLFLEKKNTTVAGLKEGIKKLFKIARKPRKEDFSIEKAEQQYNEIMNQVNNLRDEVIETAELQADKIVNDANKRAEDKLVLVNEKIEIKKKETDMVEDKLEGLSREYEMKRNQKETELKERMSELDEICEDKEISLRMFI